MKFACHILAAGGLVLLGAMAQAMAQAVMLKIAAQPMPDALNALAEQTGLHVMFPVPAVEGKVAPRVEGKYTPEAALKILLSGTRLSFEFVDAKTIAIRATEAVTAGVGTSSTIAWMMSAQESDKPSGNTVSSAAEESNKQTAQNSADSSEKLEEIVVSAQKKLERLQDVPVPITVIDTEKLATSNRVLLRDYYATVPGLAVTPNYVGRQNISLRGIGAGPLDNPTVGVLIDDMPFGSSTNHGSSIPDLDPGDLARIEVLRGPQGTLYGANSMGGLLKFITIDPSTSGVTGHLQGGVASVRNGNDPGYNVRGAVNLPVSDTFAVRASGYHRQDPGYIDNPFLGTEAVNEQRALGGLLTTLWKPAGNMSVKLNALYQRDEWDALSEAVAGLGDLQQNYIQGAGPGTRTTQAYGAVVKAQLGSVDFVSVSGYNKNKNKLTLDVSFALRGSTDPAFPYGVLYHFGVDGANYVAPNDDTERFTQEIRFSSAIGEKFEWLAGGFYSHEKSKFVARVDGVDTNTGDVVGNYGYTTIGGYNFEEYAGFADLTWHATDRLDVQIGGRQSHDRAVSPDRISNGFYASDLLGGDPVIVPRRASDENTFTYLLTPSLKLSHDLMVYARFASGYRPGGPNAVTGPGIPLQFDADRTQNYELGLKGSFLDQKLSLDGSVYYIDWSDMQFGAVIFISGAPFNHTRNGGKASSQGVELSATARPWKGTALNIFVSHSEAELAEDFPPTSVVYGASGDRLPFSAKFSGSLSLDQDFPLTVSGLTGFAGGTLSYVGGRLGPFTGSSGNPSPRQEFPAYARFDFRAGIKSDSWTLNAFVNNLTDKRALLDGGTGYFYPGARIYITPRTFGVNVTKSF